MYRDLSNDDAMMAHAEDAEQHLACPEVRMERHAKRTSSTNCPRASAVPGTRHSIGTGISRTLLESPCLERRDLLLLALDVVDAIDGQTHQMTSPLAN